MSRAAEKFARMISCKLGHASAVPKQTALLLLFDFLLCSSSGFRWRRQASCTELTP